MKLSGMTRHVAMCMRVMTLGGFPWGWASRSVGRTSVLRKRAQVPQGLRLLDVSLLGKMLAGSAACYPFWAMSSRAPNARSISMLNPVAILARGRCRSRVSGLDLFTDISSLETDFMPSTAVCHSYLDS